MKLHLTLFAFFLTQVSSAQLNNPEIGSKKKDFSQLDLLFITAKSLNINSYLVPHQDSLRIVFSEPSDKKLTDSELLDLCQYYYGGLSTAMIEDSMKYKVFCVTVCNDSFRACTSCGQMANHKYQTASSFDDKLQRFLQANFYKGTLTTSGPYNGESSIIIRYNIDTSSVYSRRGYVQAYYHTASAVLAHMIDKSIPKIRKQYKELLFLFCCDNRLLYYWRLSLTPEQLKQLYQMEFYNDTMRESSERKKQSQE